MGEGLARAIGSVRGGCGIVGMLETEEGAELRYQSVPASRCGGQLSRFPVCCSLVAVNGSWSFQHHRYMTRHGRYSTVPRKLGLFFI